MHTNKKSQTTPQPIAGVINQLRYGTTLMFAPTCPYDLSVWPLPHRYITATPTQRQYYRMRIIGSAIHPVNNAQKHVHSDASTHHVSDNPSSACLPTVLAAALACTRTKPKPTRHHTTPNNTQQPHSHTHTYGISVLCRHRQSFRRQCGPQTIARAWSVAVSAMTPDAGYHIVY